VTEDATLSQRVAALSDADAISALDLVVKNRTDVDEEVYEAERDRAIEALEQPDIRQEVDVDTDAGAGELARAALLYLVDVSPETAQEVAHAIDHPEPVGMRADPFTLAVIGVVVLALRPTVDIERDKQGKWSFAFRTRPLKDSAMATVIGKLLGAAQQNPPPQP
jgi:hypothetical protein